MAYEKEINELNLKDTELRLGLPGTVVEEEEEEVVKVEQREVSCVGTNKRRFRSNYEHYLNDHSDSPPAKSQIVGWPPVRSYQKNNNNNNNKKNTSHVKVCMDGAPYLRKIDLKIYKNYQELLKSLENMFNFSIGEYCERDGYKRDGIVPTYEDKDGDWMLLGDVPWDMFCFSCKRLRIMKGSNDN